MKLRHRGGAGLVLALVMSVCALRCGRAGAQEVPIAGDPAAGPSSEGGQPFATEQTAAPPPAPHLLAAPAPPAGVLPVLLPRPGPVARRAGRGLAIAGWTLLGLGGAAIAAGLIIIPLRTDADPILPMAEGVVPLLAVGAAVVLTGRVLVALSDQRHGRFNP